MKVSETWLREWANPSLTGQQLCAQLTMAGLEVDARYPVAGIFNKVVVAQVLETTPHPQADKLTICKVKGDREELYTIVCGAANVREGLKVALATPGAQLPGGIKIKKAKLRGQVSEGMLCSGAELGLEDKSEGILELAEDAPIGEDIRDYMNLDDHVLDVNLTPNRADCFSILGVAREVAALNGLSLKAHPLEEVKPDIDASKTIHLQASEACPQYYGRIIRGIKPYKQTPLWIKERLRRCGIRPRHPVVDVTNYVMLELGQPMHAFDLQAIEEDIHVRYGKSDETLTLLDGQNVTLTEQVLVIADEQKALALAGVMGGDESSVTDETTDIFLESAFFNPVSIAGVARHYGLSSDSSQRFERGVDPALQLPAIERATKLLQSIVGGQAGPVTRFNQPDKLPHQHTIVFNPDRVRQLSGLDIETDRIVSILESLGMTVRYEQPNWHVQIPSYRFDLTQDVDLVEEVLRLYGYDHIKAEPMVAAIEPGMHNPYETLSSELGHFLKERRYLETISYSFVDPETQEALIPHVKALHLLNPISQELSQMRTSLWPGLIASLIYNIHRQQTAVRMFETGVVFKVLDNKIEEQARIAGLVYGEEGALNWSEETRSFDFYDLKGDLEALFKSRQIEAVQFKPDAHPALHPGQSARVLVQEKEAGWIGVLHPRLLEALDLTNDVILFELSLENILREQPVQYKPISKYPQIRRDLSLLVDHKIQARQIEKAIREANPTDWLKAFDVFDVYTGENIPKDKKSLAIALTLQNDERTLVDSEINAVIDAIIKKLENEFAITLRD